MPKNIGVRLVVFPEILGNFTAEPNSPTVMWSPQLQPVAFPWSEVRAQYPAAYAALFDTSGTLGLYAQGDAPHQFSQYADLGARESGTAEYMRMFELRDLYEFFEAQNLCLGLLKTAQIWQYNAPWIYAFEVKTEESFFSLKVMAEGTKPRVEAEKMLFLRAFELLEEKLTRSGNFHVEPAAGTADAVGVHLDTAESNPGAGFGTAQL